MQFDFLNKDTICALSTPFGTGAIAILRLSGPDSFEIVSKIFKSKKFELSKIESHKAYYGEIVDNEEFIDDVITTFFKEPHSYTGEDSAEISCHGSVYIQQRLLQLLIGKGARMANPGEYTMRAYMNGRLDLAQAEAVADLIASQSKSAHDLAVNQMRGEFSNKIKELRNQLINFKSLIELELDFAEEDVVFADRKELFRLLDELRKEINLLIDSFQTGNAIKNGIPVAIIGKPNVGKSTLLNAILNEEKAIVSDLPGTTRDAIEGSFVIGGFSFRFIDTAGLRDSEDFIENLGIKRTYEKIKQANVILYVYDLTEFNKNAANEILDEFKNHISDQNKHFILIGNKADQLDKIPSHFKELVELETIFISAKRKENINLISESLLKIAKSMDVEQNTIVSNVRHYQALTESLSILNAIEQGLKSGLPTDLATVDLRQVLFHLGTITGQEIVTEEILGTIFGKFCIGK